MFVPSAMSNIVNAEFYGVHAGCPPMKTMRVTGDSPRPWGRTDDQTQQFYIAYIMLFGFFWLLLLSCFLFNFALLTGFGLRYSRKLRIVQNAFEQAW